MSGLEPAAHNTWTVTIARAMRGRRKIFVVLLVSGLVAWLLLGSSGLTSTVLTELENDMLSTSVAWAVLLIYVLLLAIPFLPSAEIGLAVMLALGSSMALPVYVATLLGLTLAFGAGRFVDRYRRSDLNGQPQETPNALHTITDWSCERPILKRLLRYRGLALIVALNMPGNTALGGGGGIAMAVGYSRTLSFPAFFACIAVAVAPVPAMFLAASASGMEAWIHDWLGSLS